MQNNQDAQLRAVCLDAALRVPGIVGTDDVLKAAQKFLDFAKGVTSLEPAQEFQPAAIGVLNA